MITIDFILNKLLKYYDLDTISELAEVLKVSQPTISKWKARNTLIPIKKKCRELEIYNDIFGDAEFYQDHIYTSGRYYSEEEIKSLKKQLEKDYDTETTNIKNKKFLNLFEILFRDCEMNNKLQELEEDIKNLILKYNPKIDKATEDLFFEFLEKNSKK